MPSECGVEGSITKIEAGFGWAHARGTMEATVKAIDRMINNGKKSMEEKGARSKKKVTAEEL